MFNIQEQLFTSALKQYEGKLLHGVNATGKGWSIETMQLPEYYQLLEVWTIFQVNLPLVDEAHDNVEQRIICAQPKEDGSVKDVVLVDMKSEKDKMQDGIKGHCIRQL
ncbi:hypothetical protein M422DRAFT_265126 [Sphaerobolus stellatus SS14]|uniref:Uncharacterized protein n=1 Tax=Sphaerobolus stellatus (strain SS14) TaxID=990650 RepID=A0A0C9TRY9_SPHS4|nr:hypothetical protein M422DRAFT_265126 [Sphaerobolus stellatus SS14]